MAATAKILVFSLLSLCTTTVLGSNYDTVYQFGDSLADAGNYIRESPSEASSRVTRLPYGVTYFKKPTGRVSDGRLLIDFLTEELGLPLLHPHLEIDSSHFHHGVNFAQELGLPNFVQELGLPLLHPHLESDSSHFQHGVNFAVAGATALDMDFLIQYNITNIPTNSSLHVQLDWFFSHLYTMYPNETECDEKIKKALILVGEIGINDYASPLLEGKSIDRVNDLVPYVIKSIRHAVEKLINRGATRLIVPGIVPMGCFPMFLTLLKNNDSSYYDDMKCLKDYNKFAEYHNKYLKEMVSMLSKENPNVIIVYADSYNAFQSILRNSEGFEKEHILKACCGTGGDYNFDMVQLCGVGGASSCPDPAKYISWDGSHFTEMGSKLMFKWILKNNLSLLKI